MSGTTTELLRRNRTPLLLGLAVLVAIVGLAVVNRDNARFGGDLDPRNPAPAGAQAVAKVLDDHGVDVRIVRNERAFRDAPVDEDTTVVVTNPVQLGRSTFAVVRSRARSAGAVVMVGDALVLDDAFGLEPRSLGTGRPVRQLRRAGRRRADHPGPVRRRGRRRGLLSETATRWPCTGRPRTGRSGCSWPRTCSATTT
jgi:hypothetical protein